MNKSIFKSVLFLGLTYIVSSGVVIAETIPKANDAGFPQNTPELKLNIPEPQLGKHRHVEAATKDMPVIEVNEADLVNNPALLERAMQSAVASGNFAGIKVLLPVYRMWPQHNEGLAKFSQAVLAQSEGRANEAVGLYRELVAAEPDAPMLRFRMAQALFEDQQNEAAADQFDRLQAESLPEAVREGIEYYRQALRERDAWQTYAGISVIRESNINQAPQQQYLGKYLEQNQCADAKAEDPNDDCYRGWRFDQPIDALALSYQAGADKKFSLSNGYYFKFTADLSGKDYPSYSRYNDLTMRIGAGIGWADSRNDLGVIPFHERRMYGNDAYSYTNGIRSYWNHWLLSNLQLATVGEMSRLKNQQRERSDSKSHLIGISWMYYPSAKQYWLLGGDHYQERNPEDKSDSFNRYGVRAGLGYEWASGLSGRAQVGYAKRRYQAPSFFSENDRRQDSELAASISIWHRAVYLRGITPKLTFSHQRNNSNDPFYTYQKNRLFVEFNKTF